MPGWPSPLRPRKPPKLATRRRAACSECGWAGGAGFVDISQQGFQFGLFKIHRAGDLGSLPSPLGQMINPPRHHQVDGQAGFQARGRARLSLLDLAAAFQGAKINIDPPPQRVPMQLFAGSFKTPDRAGGEQHPAQGFDARRSLGLLRQHRPQPQLAQLRLSARSAQGIIDRRFSTEGPSY